MPYFNFDRRNIYYDQSGAGGDLLLLHGNSVSAKMFESEIMYYSKYFKVTYFDYVGVGRSERVAKFNTDFWNYNAKAAYTLLKMLGINKTKVIGTSGGAIVGMNLGIIAPEMFDMFIGDSFFGEYISKSEADNIKIGRTKAKSQILSAAFWQKMHGDDWETIVDMDIQLMIDVAYGGINPIVGSPKYLDCPTLFTASTEDELIPNIDDRLNKLAAKMPNCEVFITNTGKHPLMITQKPTFRTLAMEFFNRNKR